MSKLDRKLKIREKVFRWFFLASDKYKTFIFWINGICRFFLTITMLLFILCFLFYIGFNYSPATAEGLLSVFRSSFLILFLSKYIPEILFLKKDKIISLVFRVLIFILILITLLTNFNLVNHEKPVWGLFYGNTIIIIAILLIGISEISRLFKLLSTIKIPPALVFSSSFFLIIFIGSGLLLLPRAHFGQLSYIDSLFTSVSAVCVTGLVVVDTATAFTTLGKIIILCLIQIGGLGIMTFTGFFSYIFTTSGSSFRDRLLLKEIFSSESMNNLFKLLAKIIILTFLTEIVGAIIIYTSLNPEVEDKILFSAFHAVSAFCNAGFSTLSGGLLSPEISNNSVHLSVAVLVILGGIGFPVLVNVYAFFKHIIISIVRKVLHNRLPVKPEKKNISIRIVLFMTAFLLLAGTGLYYLFESDTSLKGFDSTQKIVTSFFGSVSSRTAGFNMVDISLWSYPTVFLMILLMWIGASPGSTGGGIKTTTFALAFRSVWNNLRGRDHLRLGNREISPSTITRVLSIISLSILIIAAGFFCLLLSEPGKNPVHLLFECVSAFSTVGLSLADTGNFSQTGKIIDILLMFIGRVGPLTLFTGFMLSHRKNYSRYPELEIIIN
jgi:trk system potassium uptake protein